MATAVVSANRNNRFDRSWRLSESGCWIWHGQKINRGYGRISFGDAKYISAHRFSYMRFKGSLVDGLEIDHLCRNKLCVNPDHLELVTHQENVARSVPFRPKKRGKYKRNN